MSLSVCALNSGSNGNCYYISNGQEAVLVDAGLSCRETEQRMQQLGLSLALVKAIFISHEHTDHIKGLEVLSRKYALPVYISSGTLRNSHLQLDPALLHVFEDEPSFRIGAFEVISFLKAHDAAAPYSFVVAGNGVRIGVFTDIGIVCDKLRCYFAQCHAAFLEANYDEVMLQTGRYPYHLKKRISGGKGHLSNRQALELFCAAKPAFMSHLFLAHLSRDNNDPELAASLFRPHAGSTEIIVASRYAATGIYNVTASPTAPLSRFDPAPSQQQQLSLF